ncbi:MAG: membrane dipeptidase [Caldilineaceae bacterium]|nr:membrane dipeptidase [Caldilineaceae bacterium]
MLIFDGDYPMAHGALDLNRILTLPLATARTLPDQDPVTRQPNSGIMATLPEMRRGKVAGALVKVVGRLKRPNSPLWGYRSAEAAYAAAQGHLAYYRVLALRKEASLLRTRTEWDDHFAAWHAADAAGTDTADLPIGFVLGMEGADPILWPEQVEEWWVAGLRVISLTHYGVSSYAHGTGTSGGLTPAAKPLLEAMAQLGMLLDLTHIADEGFWQALAIFDGPVLASHQNCRALVPGERQFSDEQLRAIIERGGVIGVSMDTWMLYRAGNLDWAKAGITERRELFPRAAVTLADVADHIDHICQLAGNADHAAIGGDTDGQGGVEGAPAEVDSVADYQKLAAILAGRGYEPTAIEQIFFGNWARFYRKWLPA